MKISDLKDNWNERELFQFMAGCRDSRRGQRKTHAQMIHLRREERDAYTKGVACGFSDEFFIGA